MNQYPYGPSGYASRVYGRRNDPQPDASKVRDWLPWSIVSLFIGMIFVGVLPLIFSLLCRKSKKNNDLPRAQKMGKVALVLNIIITIIGIVAWIGLIAWIILLLI